MNALNDAIAADAQWLVHPALGVLADTTSGDPVMRAARLVVYVGACASPASGWIDIPASFTMWSGDRGVALPAGRLPLREAAGFVDAAPGHIAIDAEAVAGGIVEPECWAADDRFHANDERWHAEFTMCRSALQFLHDALPAVYAWATAVAPVVTPLFATETSRYRSWSRPEIPGLVFIDTHAGAQPFLESLVHEAAHRYFFLASATAPLCAETPADFRSPLRTDARPLRAVLFAYHALAYMRAFHDAYRELRPDVNRRISTRIAAELQTARAVIGDHDDLLTAEGRAFLERTDDVAAACVP